MPFQKAVLPLLISSTVALTGCIDTENTDNLVGSSTEVTTDNSGNSANQDNIEQPDQVQQEPANEEPDSNQNDDDGTNIETDSESNKVPGLAVIAPLNETFTIIDDQLVVPVSWAKSGGENAYYWQILVNDRAETPFMAIPTTNGDQQSANYDLPLFNTEAGEHIIKVALCDASRSLCSVSEPKVIVVEEDPSIFVSESGVYLRSSHDTNICLTADSSKAWAERCNDSVEQSWVFDGEMLRSGADTRLCLTANNLANLSDLSLKDCQSTDFQSWNYDQNVLRNGDWAVDLNRDTHEVIVYAFHGLENQKWLDGQTQEQPEMSGDNQDANGWVEVEVLSSGPYGSASFNLPASQNWANTGLYLRTGQTATITSEGTWNVKGGDLYGPEGDSSQQQRNCNVGQLVARVGLYYEDTNLACIGRSGTITAQTDGIVYVGAIVSTDLGETYETRRDGEGSLSVTVVSNGDTVPTIRKDLVSYYDYQIVKSGWVELRSDYNILTLPTATAIKDKTKLQDALQRLDDIYLSQKDLRGAVPHNGQAIRWFPDNEDAPGWMLAGNPIRLDPALVDANSNSRITLAAEPDNGDWGFAHELGHDFNFVNGDWYYTSSTAGLETWPNVFTVYSQEVLNLPKRELECETKSLNYKSSGVYQFDFKGDVWLSLCFLLEFKDIYGWDFYKRFYAEFNVNPTHGWTNIKNRFSDAAGEDVSHIFDEWKIPH